MAVFSNAVAAGQFARALTDITGYLNEVKVRQSGRYGVELNPQFPVTPAPTQTEIQRAEDARRRDEAQRARRAEEAAELRDGGKPTKAQNDNAPQDPLSPKAIAARTESPVPVYEVSARGAVNTTPSIKGLLVDQAR